MRSYRIKAVDQIVREGATGLADAIGWFYVEVAGLEEAEPCVGSDGEVSTLRFRSSVQEVQIRLVANPSIERTGFPIVIAVPSLEAAAELLDERSVAYETLSGISWPDRRLATNDPAGNRIELKREWPYDPL